MDKVIILCLFTILAFQLNAQKNWLSDIDRGVVAEFSADTYTNNLWSNGNSFEAGTYFLSNFTKRKKVSVDIRAGYSKATLVYDQIVNWSRFGFFNTDTSIVQKSRSGDLNYKVVYLSVPMNFRYKFNKKNSGIYLNAGMIHHFNLWTKANWKFDEYLYDPENWRDPSTNILLAENQEEDINFNSYRLEIAGGFGYKWKKVMVDFLISGGDIFADDDFIRRMVKFSPSLNFYYQLD